MTDSTVGEYLKLTSENKSVYGEKTVVFLMVGAFYEIYAIKKNNELWGSSIENISCICDLNISDKQIKYDGCSVYMCGFRDYSVDKYIQTSQLYICV